jgi:hypothetical protein
LRLHTLQTPELVAKVDWVMEGCVTGGRRLHANASGGQLHLFGWKVNLHSAGHHGCSQEVQGPGWSDLLSIGC